MPRAKLRAAALRGRLDSRPTSAGARLDAARLAAEARIHAQRWQRKTCGLAACLLGRGRNCQRCGELLITARRAADLDSWLLSPYRQWTRAY